ncbi:SPFH domain-containing protein [Clostridium bornimense]|uniref:SPFH domain-containing protein n=1 Tax=Clostridium bornimense TaxID=1216932 RepID=UPI001C10F0D8|nr:SPFH domain-containing protein [Clostridium bornimense]MBU5316366.1 SPFH domain-containing protein [Clostridium bornimense]
MLNFKFIKFLPSEYVIRYRNGKIVQEGVGLSFMYFVPNTSVVVVPIASSDIPFMFQETTSDYQTVTIQGEITYKICDYKKIAGILDYTFDLKSRKYVSEDNKKISQRLINITKVLAKKYIENMDIRTAIKYSDKLAKEISEDLQNSKEIENLGIEIMRLSILAINPTKEMSRALEAEAREKILNKADDAIYERRNASINQERTIKENELNTEVAMEGKKKQIKETQLEGKRLIMQKENKIKSEELDYEIKLEEKKKELIEISVENSKARADAKAYELSAMMKVLEDVNPTVLQALSNMGMSSDKLIAMAFQELADNASKIGQLNITPDLLQGLLKGCENRG